MQHFTLYFWFFLISTTFDKHKVYKGALIPSTLISPAPGVSF